MYRFCIKTCVLNKMQKYTDFTTKPVHKLHVNFTEKSAHCQNKGNLSLGYPHEIAKSPFLIIDICYFVPKNF
jgi:hypothetical protein